MNKKESMKELARAKTGQKWLAFTPTNLATHVALVVC